MKKVKKKPKWSLKSVFYTLVFFGGLSSGVLFFLDNLGTKEKIIIAFGAIAVWHTFFCFTILYFGVKFNSNERLVPRFSKPSKNIDVFPDFSMKVFGQFFDEASIFLPIGIVIDIILAILFWLILTGLFYFGFNLIFTIMLIIAMPVFYLFQKSIRLIRWKGRKTLNNFKLSLLYSSIALLHALIFLGSILCLYEFFTFL